MELLQSCAKPSIWKTDQNMLDSYVPMNSKRNEYQKLWVYVMCFIKAVKNAICSKMWTES